MANRFRRVGKRKIDPSRVQVRVRSEAAVQGYMANPNWSGPDFCGNGGDPRVYIHADGTMTCDIGNHRIAAAARTGRDIKAEVWVERGPAEQRKREDSYFAWLWS